MFSFDEEDIETFTSTMDKERGITIKLTTCNEALRVNIPGPHSSLYSGLEIRIKKTVEGQDIYHMNLVQNYQISKFRSSRINAIYFATTKRGVLKVIDFVYRTKNRKTKERIELKL